MEVRKYARKDIPAMIKIWNTVVEEGNAFPQEEFLNEETGKLFFASQSYCAVAAEGDRIFGLYILHPNNIGRCGHIIFEKHLRLSGRPCAASKTS